MANPWLEYGLVKSPFADEEEKIYKNNRKTQLFTNTKDYIAKRNEYMSSLKDDVDNQYIKTMRELKARDIPLKKAQELAKDMGKNLFDEGKKIAQVLWPI